MFDPLVKGGHRLLKFGRRLARFRIERLHIFVFGRDVFTLLGEREITVNRRQDVRA